MSIEPIKRINRIYGYVRVSTGEQAAHGISLETQQQEISEFVRHKYNCEVDEFFVDDGYSGKIPAIVGGEANPERPGMASLLNALEEYDVVITTRLDRLSRSTNDLLTMIPFFQEIQMTLFFSEQFGDVPIVYPKPKGETGLKARFDMGDITNKIMLTVLGAVAEIEHATIKDRFGSGKLDWAERGYAIGGSAPFGFMKEVEMHGKSKRRHKLVPHPENYEVLQRILKMHRRKNGKSLQKIADEINALYPNQNMYKEKIKRIVNRKYQGLAA